MFDLWAKITPYDSLLHLPLKRSEGYAFLVHLGYAFLVHFDSSFTRSRSQYSPTHELVNPLKEVVAHVNPDVATIYLLPIGDN